MTISHQTQKGTRLLETVAPVRDILESDPEIVASGKKEKKDDGNLESNQKRNKSIAVRIGQTLKLPSQNKDEDYEDKE